MSEYKNPTVQKLHDLGMLGEWRGEVAELLLEGSDIYERYCGPDGIFNVDDPCFGEGMELDDVRHTVSFTFTNDENMVVYESCMADLELQDNSLKFQSIEGDFHLISVWFATKMHAEGDPPKGVSREQTTYQMTLTDIQCLINAINVFLLDDDHAMDCADHTQHSIRQYYHEYAGVGAHMKVEHTARTLLARAEKVEASHPGVSLFESLC